MANFGQSPKGIRSPDSLKSSTGEAELCMVIYQWVNIWTDDLNLIVYEILYTPQPITYSGDQVVTQTALGTKNPWLYRGQVSHVVTKIIKSRYLCFQFYVFQKKILRVEGILIKQTKNRNGLLA